MEELSKFQRLLLVNQYKILEKLYPENAEGYAETREALEKGYPDWYEEDFGWVVYDGLTKAQCHEINEILSMFWEIKMAYDNLDDKSGIDIKSLTYKGLDGNNEHDLKGYADYLINTKNRFDGLVAQNSHSSGTLPMYRRMLEVWNTLDSDTRPTKEDMVRLTQAQIHPSNR